MKNVLLKRIFFGFAVMSIFAGCGAKGGASSTGAGLDADFFDQKIEGEITVSAYDTMFYRAFLEEAARGFEALNPGTKINIETFSAMPEVRTGGDGNMQMSYMQGQNDPNAKNDYLSRVNTNIMSGTGADIYAMDVLPLHKFAESGTLENLEPYMNMDPAFNKADYRQNILDAVRYNGGTMFLPMDYSFNYFAYDATLVPAQIAAGFGPDKAFSTADLMNLGMTMYDGSHKLFNLTDYSRGPSTAGGGGMFSQLLNESITTFINLETGRANFADGKFTGLLASVRDYAEQGYIPKGVTGQQSQGQRSPGSAPTVAGIIEAPTDRYYFKLYGNANLMGQYTRGFGLMMRMMNAGSAATIDTDDLIAGIQANADGSVPFTFSKGFAINSQSKNKAMAWAFMKYLLSNEMQMSTSVLNMGHSINNEARAQMTELSFSTSFAGPGRAGTTSATGVTLTDQQRQALNSYMAALESLSDRINTYVVQDPSLNDMISPEVYNYFTGTRSADEVARVLQNRVDLYLSE